MTLKSLIRAVTLSAALCALAVPAAMAQAPGDGPQHSNEAKGSAASDGSGAGVIPGHYIVQVERGHDPKGLAEEHGAKPRFVYRHAVNGFAAELTDKQVDKLKRHPRVTLVEPDLRGEIDATQYTDANGDPWGLDRIDQRTGLSRSFSYFATGSGVNAYVIDTGIQTSHPQFGGRAANVYDAFRGNGQDCNGHGTHVAGTIGGATYGVAKSVRLYGLRTLDCGGYGDISATIAAVDWLRVNHRKPAVTNMSLGWPANSTLNKAVTNLVNAGVFVAVSAGNDGRPACEKSPASAYGSLTVAASDRYDRRAGFSNYGACADVYAPGVAVKSAWIGSGVNTINGTSMASPHVAGLVALGKSWWGDGYTSYTWNDWVINNSTANVISGNISGTPNRLIFKGSNF